MKLSNEEMFELYEGILEAVDFDTIKYQGSHGKDPKGTGGWMFSLQSTTDGKTFKIGDVEVRTPNLPYAKAKAEAVKLFKAKGYKPSSIWVMP